MPRLNFDITKEQHQQLKTLASYSGLSMKEFVLSRVFAQAAETVFQPKQMSKNASELERVQKAFFSKENVIILSEEKWAEFQEKVK